MPLAAFYYQKSASLGDSIAMMHMKYIFEKEPVPTYNLGYIPDEKLTAYYTDLYYQLDKNADLKFPNLQKEHPLPRHPVQGYDAENPDVRPE